MPFGHFSGEPPVTFSPVVECCCARCAESAPSDGADRGCVLPVCSPSLGFPVQSYGISQALAAIVAGLGARAGVPVLSFDAA